MQILSRQQWQPRYVFYVLLILLAVAPPHIGSTDGPIKRDKRVKGALYDMWRIPRPDNPQVVSGFVLPWPPPLPFASKCLRVAAILGLLWLAVRKRRAIVTRIKAFFMCPDEALNLAIFRMITFATLAACYTYGRQHVNGQEHLFEGFPDDLLRHRSGLVGNMDRIDSALYFYFKRIFIVACCLGAVGLCTRTAAAVVLLVSPFVMGLPQQFVAQNYTTDHLIWFVAIMAVSPSADAFSLDAWIRKRRGLPAYQTPSIAYGLPLRFIWLLIALIYFFSGFWKLWVCGWAWITGDTLRNLMYFFWANGQFVPLIRPDGSPLLCKLSALWVVSYELFFVLAIFSSRLRLIWAVEGILFLCGVYYFLGVNFFYVLTAQFAFFDWKALQRKCVTWWRRSSEAANEVDVASPDAQPIRTSIIASSFVGIIFVIGTAVCGAIPMVAWPFAVYPTFNGFMGTVQPDLALYIRHKDGTLKRVTRQKYHAYHWYGLKLKMLIEVQKVSKEEKRRLLFWFLRFWRPGEVAPGEHYVFVKEWMSTLPDSRNLNPLTSEILIEFVNRRPAGALPRRKRLRKK